MAGSTADTAAGADQNSDGPAAAEEDQDGEGLLADEELATHPALAKAADAALSDMASISIHTGEQTFADELKSTIYPSSRPLVVIECPTSRQTTPLLIVGPFNRHPRRLCLRLAHPVGVS